MLVAVCLVMRRSGVPLLCQNATPRYETDATSWQIRHLNRPYAWHGHCNNVFA